MVVGNRGRQQFRFTSHHPPTVVSMATGIHRSRLSDRRENKEGLPAGRNSRRVARKEPAGGVHRAPDTEDRGAMVTPRPHCPRSLPARHPPNGAWPAEMRADMAAAYLDYATTGQLLAAVMRGQPPPPTANPLPNPH